MASTIVCIPVTPDGLVEPRWGRAPRVAVATVEDGAIAAWTEHDVRWDALHDEGTEGGHHARIARFLMDNGAQVVVVDHMGPPMARMLDSMGLGVVFGASGEARAAVVAGVAAIAAIAASSTGALAAD